MYAIHRTAILDATPDQVFQALTEQEHLRAWWTELADAEPKKGGRVRVDFPAADAWAEMEVIELLPGSLVQWHVKDSRMRGEHWTGTTIRWDLRPAAFGGKLAVELTHEGWQERNADFQECRRGWDHYLLKSLKPYLEDGQGSPFTGEGWPGDET